MRTVTFLPSKNHCVVAGSEEKVLRVFDAPQSFVDSILNVCGIKTPEDGVKVSIIFLRLKKRAGDNSVQCVMYSAQCTVNCVLCTVCSVQFSVRCSVDSIQCTVFSCSVQLQCTVYIVATFFLCGVFSVQCTVYCVQRTV